LLWRRRWGGGLRALLSTIVGIAGAVVGVLGVANEGTRLTAVGLLLLGYWWLETGLALRDLGARKLAWLTMALGIVAVFGAVDTGLWMLPWIPASPAWGRLLLELVWVPWVAIAALRGIRKQEEVMPTLAAEPGTQSAPVIEN